MQVKTVDGNVVILCLIYADDAMSNGIKSFLVVYGPKDKNVIDKINVFYNFNKFSVGMCKGLAFFHAFTGCDTV